MTALTLDLLLEVAVQMLASPTRVTNFLENRDHVSSIPVSPIILEQCLGHCENLVNGLFNCKEPYYGARIQKSFSSMIHY